MEQQPIQITQTEAPRRKKQYTLDDMYHIAELYEHYYLAVNTRGNVLSPNRVRINKAHWAELTAEYNTRQNAILNGESYVRTEKALNDKRLAMRTQYQAKKGILKSTGSGGGPISGYLKKMHEFLHDDPQFHPKATYSSSKRQYVVGDDEEDLCADGPSSSSSQKKKARLEKKEESRLKARGEALDRMEQITQKMTSRLEEIMSKPLAVHHIESEEKKEFYKKFLELMEKGLK